MGKRLAGALAILALCACTSTASSAKPGGLPTTAATSGDSFFAVVPTNGGSIAQLSTSSGTVTRRIALAKRDGMSVNGLARFSQDSLLVTHSTGPLCSSNLAGCGPRPNTCGAEVDTLNVKTGAVKVLWRTGRDQRLSAARPSPDGTKIAVLASPCVPFFNNDHLVVRRLSDGVSWSIGEQEPRCHALGAPQWTADSAHLLVTYAPSTGTRPHTGNDGFCNTAIGDRQIVKVDAGHHQPLITGVTTTAPVGCRYQAIASAGPGTYAVQACGTDSLRMQGPATLVRLDQALHVTQRWPIGRCTDGNDIAADSTQGVILAAYLYCNANLGPQEVGDPITALDRVDGAALHRVAAVHSGETPFAYLTW
jgi:hypothetical protein